MTRRVARLFLFNFQRQFCLAYIFFAMVFVLPDWSGDVGNIFTLVNLEI